MIVSSESEIRANLVCEMITLAKSHTTPRFSKNLYYAAVVILVRSCSTYEFVRTFLPLPNPRAVYAHFWFALAASRDRLQSLDAMIAYLSVQVAQARADRGLCLGNRCDFLFKCISRDETC
jgi:hypothetical protein